MSEYELSFSSSLSLTLPSWILKATFAPSTLGAKSVPPRPIIILLQSDGYASSTAAIKPGRVAYIYIQSPTQEDDQDDVEQQQKENNSEDDEAEATEDRAPERTESPDTDNRQNE